MNDELLAEHNRLFLQAAAMIQGEIPLHGQPDLPAPDLLQTRKLKSAITLFERVVEMNPTNWSAMWLVGKIYQRFQNTPVALSWFVRSFRVNPSQPDVAREVSICAMEIGRHDVAIAAAERATQIEPNNPGLHSNLALAYLLAGRIPEAQTASRIATEGDPSDTISQTIQSMVQHFAESGLLPPTTTPDLLIFWSHNSPRSQR
jgi:Flp pilus assembly protein TadD